jgi:hypothetical protein
MALDLIAEMEALVDGFQREHVEYAVCGGLALGLHGHPRATMDIDFLVRAEQLADGMRIARGLAFDIPARKMTFGLAAGTPREVQRLSKLDTETGSLLSLDLLVVSSDLEEVWSARIRVGSRDRELWIVSREGLATMKRMAGRPKDLLDLAILEGTADDEPTS